MACNATLDRVKILRRHEARVLGPDEGFLAGEGTHGSDPASEAAARECREILNGTLEALKPKERSALESFYLDGLSHQMIAQQWSLSVDGVEALIRRTREKLKQALSEKGLEGA